MRLETITEDDRSKIISIFRDDDVITYNDNYKEEDTGIDAFVLGLNDEECDDVFYDHSVPISKIFKELSCIPTGFQYNNDYYDPKYPNSNNHYLIWFSKVVEE